VKACRKLGPGGKAGDTSGGSAGYPRKWARRQGFIGGRRFGSGKRRRWCAARGKEPRCHRETEIFGVPVVRQGASVDSLDGLAFRLNRLAQASTRAECSGRP
jgi:hypothetical protein